MNALLTGLQRHCVLELRETYPNSNEAIKFMDVIGQVGVMSVLFEEMYRTHLAVLVNLYPEWKREGFFSGMGNRKQVFRAYTTM